MGKILKALEKSKSQKQYKDTEQRLESKKSHLAASEVTNQKSNIQANSAGQKEKKFIKTSTPSLIEKPSLTEPDSMHEHFSQLAAANTEYRLQAKKTYEKSHTDKFYNEVSPAFMADSTEYPLERNEITKKLFKLRKQYSKEHFEKIHTIPRSAEKMRKNDLVTIHKPNKIISEQFKVSRSLVSNVLRENKLKTILVTSSLPLEGKSYVSANLAVSIARGLDEHVLLVDTDIDNPSLQSIFQIQSEMGLTDFLVNEKFELSDIIKKTQVPKLSLLPAGVRYERSSELLASELMSLLIQELKYRYDDRYVIFDSSPIIISKSLAITDKVDAVIIIVRAGKTDRKLVYKTVDMIGREKVLGIIMNYCKESYRNYSKKYIKRYL